MVAQVLQGTQSEFLVLSSISGQFTELKSELPEQNGTLGHLTELNSELQVLNGTSGKFMSQLLVQNDTPG